MALAECVVTEFVVATAGLDFGAAGGGVAAVCGAGARVLAVAGAAGAGVLATSVTALDFFADGVAATAWGFARLTGGTRGSTCRATGACGVTIVIDFDAGGGAEGAV